ncbi:MAG: hypothetical protein AB1597_05235 [Chloroflexota bacterium]
MDSGPVINILGMQCSVEGEARFDAWYSGKHIPDLLKCKAIKKVTRYRLMDGSGKAPVGDYPKFLAIYEFKDRKGFEEFNDSLELAAAREDTARIFAETGGRLLWRVQYEAIGTWQQ